MLKTKYYKGKKHCQYFSLYWTEQLPLQNDTLPESENSGLAICLNYKSFIHIVASKKGVHRNATKRNFVKRRLRAVLQNFFKSEPVLLKNELKIVGKKEILQCSFLDLNLTLCKNLKAILK